MYYHVYSIMQVKDSLLSVVRVGYRVPLEGFYLSLYVLHMLNSDVNMIQTKNSKKNAKRYSASMRHRWHMCSAIVFYNQLSAGNIG